MGDKPINLLSLDGGGIRGLSELYILEEMMLRIKYKYKLEKAPLPADFFDIIGGSSTGGFVCAIPQQDVRPPAGPTLFRTYEVGKHKTHNCTIYDACRATSAEPAYFGPVEIGESYEREKFIGGGVGYNNPIEQVIQEAESVYPGRKVACIVSIGAGLAREIKFPDSPDMGHPKLSTALMDMARESDTVAEKMEVRFRKATETYFRFSVDRGLDNLNLQECEDIPNVKTYTTSYARQASICDKIDTVVHRLVVSKAQYQANGSTAVVPLTHHISASRPAVPDQHIKRAELTWHIDDASRPHFPLNTHDISGNSM
ncbi:hypothetical protein Sste5346_006066 [Sporothrix stenoceras]|uniref:PNPLA domain-containing protein n=1 Tax=Sporothrix stenoceras TaxID=5173 RepID=A0ABR3Z1I9_9PEZI